MPELPEVETIVRGLERHVTGDRIESVWIGSRPQPLKSPASVIARTLEGKRIAHLHRAGKHIVFELVDSAGAGGGTKSEPRWKSGPSEPALSLPKGPRKALQSTSGFSLGGRLGHTQGLSSRSVTPRPSKTANELVLGRERADKNVQWVVHLGMTGRLVVSDPASEVVKHTHLIAKLASGRELRFVDPRMFGRLSVHTDGFDPGGVEPLEVSEENFVALFRGRRTPIKSALLNQKLVRGVGNIYADESLFRAGIRPRRRASTITRRELSKLYRAVRQVLREAIKLGGSSVSDYVDADGEEGFFQLRHRVYGREGEPCLVCGTAIRRVVLVGRSSHYCPRCQR